MAKRKPAKHDLNNGTRSHESAWRLCDQAIERALLTGEFPNELESLFGEAGRDELSALARQAAARRRRGGQRVIIIPGIMGSKLGRKHKTMGLEFEDVYWLDPVDFALGVAKKLAFDSTGDASIEPLGVFLSSYLKLKLSLIIAGYDAEFYAYDWRRNIRELGKGLQSYIGRLGLGAGSRVSLVAHSMGGLVARAALKAGADSHVDRLIMLGTPNFGSFSPVQALRGVLSTVKQLAALDLTSNSNMLANIFGTFVGLCQMLPDKTRFPAADFFSRAAWPANTPALRENVLKESKDLQPHLALPPTDNQTSRRMFLVAGHNQSTIVGASLTNDRNEFTYASSNQGDGTVPWELARLDNAITYFVEEQHGSLPNNPAVIGAIKDILAQGETSALSSSLPTFRSVATQSVLEQHLSAEVPFENRRASGLRAAETRSVLEHFVAPLAPLSASFTATPSLSTSPTSPCDSGAAGPDLWSKLTVSRVRQRRLEIHLANASITDIEARAYVLGLFREVTPSGAAAAVDREMQGVISEFTQRRMFGGQVGEVFVLPANRSRLRSDMVVFAGLGSFDGFNDDVQRITAENVARVLIRTHIENFATVLIGGSNDGDISHAVENILRGFFRAIQDADTDQNFRRVTVCELDSHRYQAIRQTLYQLASTPLFDDIEVTLTELRPVPAPAQAFGTPQDVARQMVGPVPDPVYLVVRHRKINEKSIEVSSSLLPPSSKAAILSDSMVVAAEMLKKSLSRLESETLTFGNLDEFGKNWAKLVLPPSIATVLPSYAGRHLIVVHDADSSRLPWETLLLGDWSPARSGGLSHRYLADNLSVAKYLDERRREKLLQMLLIVDPTETLVGAEKESDRINKLLSAHSSIQVDSIRGKEGSRQRILKAISSGKYDVLHYAGHAAFNPAQRSESGIKCTNGEVLSGADLSRVTHLPSLVFFNACESARVRRKDAKETEPDIEKLRQKQVGFAEAFLRGGVANYVGTYWPVGDSAAESFGVSFYGDILAGRSIGDAVLNARKKLHTNKELDWADYIHYGDHRFRIKLLG